MDNGRRGAVDELEVRRPSEGYELWRNMRLISSIAAKRLSSTEFISHKNTGQGGRKEADTSMTLGANDGPTSRREGGASNNPAGAANA